MEDQKKHPHLDFNQYYPILEDKKHPFLDEYYINSSLIREMLNNHQILDENVRSINIQKRKQNIPPDRIKDYGVMNAPSVLIKA